MDKIICDICGTAYDEAMENCPVCGCSKTMGLEGIFDDTAVVGQEAAPRKKNKEIFDFDVVNQPSVSDEEEEDEDDYEEEYEERPRSNTFLVVVLLILIVLLLATAGFFFLRYFLPNMQQEPETTVPVATTEAPTVETVPADTGIPCTDIAVPGGKIELVVGGKWLMNVQVYPADTTDTLVFASADESIATVTEDGTVTAVKEGQTQILITCGSASIPCNILVDNTLEEQTEPTGTIPAMEAEETTAETTGEAVEETTGEAAAETTAPAEETTEATIPEGEQLKLKKTDISIFSNYTSVKLELDCAIPAEDIYWFTMDSTVAIVNDGVVTSTGSGITRIYGEYEGQRVECIVRCNF